VKEDVLKCHAGQHKGRWYAWLPEHEVLWERMREGLAVVDDWTAEPSSGDHAAGSDAHIKDATPETGEPDAHLSGGLARAHAREHTLDEHLILGSEHLTTPDAQMLIGEETGADLKDQAYFDALAAEIDA
jgi:hypothetical protein